jgi:hypothetical protein
MYYCGNIVSFLLHGLFFLIFFNSYLYLYYLLIKIILRFSLLDFRFAPHATLRPTPIPPLRRPSPLHPPPLPVAAVMSSFLLRNGQLRLPPKVTTPSGLAQRCPPSTAGNCGSDLLRPWQSAVSSQSWCRGRSGRDTVAAHGSGASVEACMAPSSTSGHYVWFSATTSSFLL